jgi:hypothetical protein
MALELVEVTGGPLLSRHCQSRSEVHLVDENVPYAQRKCPGFDADG